MSALSTLSGLAGSSSTPFMELGAAAFVAGLASSVHCFAMCGPLACFGCSRSVGYQQRGRAIGAYHAARAAAYGTAGALAGLAGAGVFKLAGNGVTRWLPWVMAAFLVASAVGLGERALRVPGLAQFVRHASAWSANRSPVVRSAVLGAVTPLLPCGLLIGLFSVATLAGPMPGAVLAASFALGGIPALTLGQLQSTWAARLPRGWDTVMRRAVPAVAAGVLIYRAITPEHCPMCP